jgi:hypothetical protein
MPKAEKLALVLIGQSFAFEHWLMFRFFDISKLLGNPNPQQKVDRRSRDVMGAQPALLRIPHHRWQTGVGS